MGPCSTYTHLNLYEGRLYLSLLSYLKGNQPVTHSSLVLLTELKSIFTRPLLSAENVQPILVNVLIGFLSVLKMEFCYVQ
jgi:hypothetical protein